MADSPISVSFSEIANAGSSITQMAGKLDGMLDDLKSRVAKAIAAYEGASSDGFQKAKKDWNDSAESIQQILLKIGQAVEKAADDYQRVEGVNSGRWNR